MERDCCEFICGAPTTFQGYGIEYLTVCMGGRGREEGGGGGLHPGVLFLDSVN